jgi:hypothetical protein
MYAAPPRSPRHGIWGSSQTNGSTLRADSAPGGIFPGYELTDYDKTRRRLSKLPGGDPMILALPRGPVTPKTISSTLSERLGTDPRWPRRPRNSSLCGVGLQPLIGCCDRLLKEMCLRVRVATIVH